MKECEQLPAGQRRICEGVSGLPLERTNAYRRKWGLEPLAALPEGVIVRELPEVRSQRDPFALPVEPASVPQGPGTELKAIFEQHEIPACQACHDLAAKMNGWGVGGCRERTEEIVEEILPRAREWVKHNRPWVHALLPGLIEDYGIRQRLTGYVSEAITRAAVKEADRVKKKSPDIADLAGL